MLFVDKRPIDVIEAKAVGSTLSGVESQTAKYSNGLQGPLRSNAWHEPLPFLYQSTGVETFFTDKRDPHPRSRRVFAFHQPDTLAQYARPGSSSGSTPRVGEESPPYGEAPTLRARLRHMPPLNTAGLWSAQIEAVRNLEHSLAQDRPRSLVQMDTGSGKTYIAVTTIYRLIKHAKARRVLFMIDRTNLGRQAHNEFKQYTTPDDGRKFTELYNVQHLQSNALDRVSKVCITTVQRLYSMLKGEPDFDPTLENRPLGKMMDVLGDSVREVVYSDYLPIEYFDFIFIDECHRSIYNVWRQVLEYFDDYLIGLTATPSKQTLGFFNGNLVMEYPRERAVADGVNVDGWVYRIRTRVTEHGSRVEAGWVGKRDRKTREQRWEQLDEELDYDAAQLDRDVVTPDQIRTVMRTFRDRLFTDIFPDREEVPKTLIFAKDDAHAEEIVRIVREEFGKGNEFCKKITYKSEGKTPEELIPDFRNSYFPRIAVSVDMIATGTDVKPIEILLFMRRVSSAPYFEQMIGRGTRVITETDLRGATPDAIRKSHFVIVDAVGVVEHPKIEVGTMDRKRSIAFEKLLEKVAFRMADEDDLSSLAVRLSRLESDLTEDEREAILEVSGGKFWTTEALWRAYAQLERDKVRGVGAKRRLTDLVSLVRHAVQLKDELIPYPDLVQQRYEEWLAEQEAAGRAFTEEQRWWLDRIAETIGVNLSVRAEDFQYGELFNRGGWHAAREALGEELPELIEEMNETMAL